MENQDLELAEILHTIFCPHEHVDQMELIVNREDGYCYWYLEESIDKCWEKKDHLMWLLRAKIFIAHCTEGGLNPAGITDSIADLVGVCKSLLDFYEINPKLRKFVVGLLIELK